MFSINHIMTQTIHILPVETGDWRVNRKGEDKKDMNQNLNLLMDLFFFYFSGDFRTANFSEEGIAPDSSFS